MKQTFRLSLLALVGGAILSGCSSAPTAGSFAGGSYQQITLEQPKEVTTVTVLRLTTEAQKELIKRKGTMVIGKSVFTIDSDNLNDDQLEAQAKVQAQAVHANVVLLSETFTGKEDKTKIVEKKSDFQQAAEDVPLLFDVDAGGTTKSTSSTINSDGSSSYSSSEHTSPVSAFGIASLGQLTALVPGNIVHEKVKYKVSDYDIHAIYIRSPMYPGLK